VISVSLVVPVLEASFCCNAAKTLAPFSVGRIPVESRDCFPWGSGAHWTRVAESDGWGADLGPV